MIKNVKLNKFNGKLLDASIFLGAEFIEPFVKNAKDTHLKVEIEKTRDGIFFSVMFSIFSMVMQNKKRKLLNEKAPKKSVQIPYVKTKSISYIVYLQLPVLQLIVCKKVR
ncbi:Uncharacterised protein [uncultured archaeon]|nr:Uncharacterised protein [uncultured archaeon]